MKKISELPLTELLALYNNYMNATRSPTRDQRDFTSMKFFSPGDNNLSWAVIDKLQFKLIDAEIKRRVLLIDFKN